MSWADVDAVVEAAGALVFGPGVEGFGLDGGGGLSQASRVSIRWMSGAVAAWWTTLRGSMVYLEGGLMVPLRSRSPSIRAA